MIAITLMKNRLGFRDGDFVVKNTFPWVGKVFFKIS